MPKYWSLSAVRVLEFFKVNRLHGLTNREATLRLRQRGGNEIRANHQATQWRILVRQLISPLVLVLYAALLLAIIERQTTDGLVIVLVIVSNAIIGYYQESKAEETIGKLRQVLSLQARVVREGIEEKIPARLVVPGDIVLLEAGDQVPADVRILEARSLRINQATLTGESVPVHKGENVLAPVTSLADRTNMAYMSTLVVGGQGVGVVVATGMNTELGRIAQEVTRVKEKPEEITRQVNRLGTILISLAIGLGVLALVIGLIRGVPVVEMVSTTLSLLVSIVPEGLPVAVTVTLSLSLVRIFHRRAIIRKLAAVETLGSATVICIDKTGTVTEGQVMVEKLFVGGEEFRVDGVGYGLSGHFYRDGKRCDVTKVAPARLLLELTSLATMSTITKADLSSDEAKQLTDPTETALAVVAAKAGFYAFDQEKVHPELLEVPFDQELRYSTSIHRFGKLERYITKGAPEKILQLSHSYVTASGRVATLLPKSRAELEERANEYARQGYRVAALAYLDRHSAEVSSKLSGGLVLVGLLAMIDPIRNDARQVIEQIKAAGVKVVMITGDHVLTAQAVGEKIGLLTDGRVIHVDELHHHPLKGVTVIARATPAEKLLIVERLQKEGEIVAMTGDGVNDAPALKRADIGVAMGRNGTDVAVEAADMVLLGDNLSAMITAVEQGRLVWENLKKIIYYLVSTSLAEAAVIVGALLLRLPLPLLAVQILWLNLVTDGVSSIALAFEAPEENLMSRGARRPGTTFIDAVVVRRMFLATTVTTAGALVLFGAFSFNLDLARTIALTTIVFFELFNLFNSRSEISSIFVGKAWKNRPLVGLFLLALGLQLVALYAPVANRLLHTVPLSWLELLTCVIVALGIIFAEELRKFTVRSLRLWAKSQQDLGI